MVLPHYRAVVQNKCILILQHIYFCINILLVFHEYILQQYKEQYIIFLPDLDLHLITFLCSPIFCFTNFRFYKIIVHS